MPRGKSISFAKRSSIIILHEKGCTYQLAGRWKIEFGRIYSKVHNSTISGYRRLKGSWPSRVVENHYPSRWLSTTINKYLSEIAVNSTWSSERIQLRFEDPQSSAGWTTVIYMCCCCKPLLRRGIRVKRLRWAQEHRDWAVEQWEKDLWSDEFIFRVI